MGFTPIGGVLPQKSKTNDYINQGETYDNNYNLDRIITEEG